MIEEFKELGENHETPKEVEDEVFSTLDSMKLLADIVDLFTLKYTKTGGELIDLSTPSSEPEKS